MIFSDKIDRSIQLAQQLVSETRDNFAEVDQSYQSMSSMVSHPGAGQVLPQVPGKIMRRGPSGHRQAPQGLSREGSLNRLHGLSVQSTQNSAKRAVEPRAFGNST